MILMENQRALEICICIEKIFYKIMERMQTFEYIFINVMLVVEEENCFESICFCTRE